MPDPHSPSGRIAGYLLSDIEGSTQRWERSPTQMRAALKRHYEIIEAVLERHGGRILDRAGDGVCAIFTGGNPLECALDLQLALQGEDWNGVNGLKVRIGIHAGSLADKDGADHVAINRAARMLAFASGGQVLVSAEAAAGWPTPLGARLRDLGPCHLRDLSIPMRIFLLAHPELEHDRGPRLLANSAAYEIPGLAGGLIGRAEEMRELESILNAPEVRLATLLGPGGNGKTKLAAHLAAERAKVQPVFFVCLSGVPAESDFVSAIAATIGLTPQTGVQQTAQLADFLSGKRCLVVLDGADAFRQHAAQLGELMCACEDMQILTTSRAPLEIAGELTFPVKGLACRSGLVADVVASPAYQLFLSAYIAHGLGAVLGEEEAEDFATLNAALGGSPLGLQLSARWRGVLPLSVIVQRIRSDTSVLSLPEEAPERNLRKIVEASWELLSADQRAVLARLSVFAGGFDADAASAVAQASPELLLGLEARGLIERAGDRRFSLHALIRAYADEKLSASGALPQARAQHSAYYLALVRANLTLHSQDEQPHALARVSSELANVGRAWERLLAAGNADEIFSCGEALFYFFALQSRFKEADGFFTAVAGDDGISAYLGAMRANVRVHLGALEEAERLARKITDGEHAVLAAAHALQALGNLYHVRGDLGRARSYYERALEARARDLMGQHYSLLCLAAVAILEGDGERARAYLKSSYLICRRSHNLIGMMHAHYYAGDLAEAEGRVEDARANYAASLDVEERVKCPLWRAIILNKLGVCLLRTGEKHRAQHCYLEALSIAEQLGDKHVRTAVLIELGRAYRVGGESGQSRSALLLAARLALSRGSRPQLARALAELAELESLNGASEQAARLRAMAPKTVAASGAPGTQRAARSPSLSEIEAGLAELFEAEEAGPLRL